MKTVMLTLLVAVLTAAGTSRANASDASSDAIASRLCSAASSNQQVTLLLQDGSDHVVSHCTVSNGRVHYFSADRYVWEEVPFELVNWKSSEERFERATTPPAIPRDAAVAIEPDAEDASVGASSSPEAAPGVRLPEYGDVFLLEDSRGRKRLKEVVQTRGKVVRTQLIPGPSTLLLGGGDELIVIDAAAALVRTTTARPQLFIHVDNEARVSRKGVRKGQQSYVLVRLAPSGTFRIVDAHDHRIFKHNHDAMVTVPVTTTQLQGDWLQISPGADLAPGEYGVVEIIGKKITMNVWDFAEDRPAGHQVAEATQRTEGQNR